MQHMPCARTHGDTAPTRDGGVCVCASVCVSSRRECVAPSLPDDPSREPCRTDDRAATNRTTRRTRTNPTTSTTATNTARRSPRYTHENQVARRRVRKSPAFDALVRELWELVRDDGDAVLREVRVDRARLSAHPRESSYEYSMPRRWWSSCAAMPQVRAAPVSRRARGASRRTPRVRPPPVTSHCVAAARRPREVACARAARSASPDLRSSECASSASRTLIYNRASSARISDRASLSPRVQRADDRATRHDH